MTGTRPDRSRRGYTLTIVLISLMLLFALWCFVSRTMSSALRVETNRVLQQTRDQGAMNALGSAIQLLQYSEPSDSTNPSRTVFTYGLTVKVPDASGAGTPTDYTIVYTARPDLGSQRWEIQVSPGTSAVPLPSVSVTPSWP
jgi:hypothetical protein